MALGQTQRPVFLVRLVSLSNWPLLVAYGPDLKVTKGVTLRQTQGPGYPCTVSELVELAVISCSGTKFESDEASPYGKLKGRF